MFLPLLPFSASTRPAQATAACSQRPCVSLPSLSGELRLSHCLLGGAFLLVLLCLLLSYILTVRWWGVDSEAGQPEFAAQLHRLLVLWPLGGY